MRIGLLRHFPVEPGLPRGWRTAGELDAWRERYDASEPVVGAFDLGGVAWSSCVASDLPRAAATARAVFAGDIEHTPLLREPRFAPFRTGRLRLPVLGWRLLLQMAWATGHRSQREGRDDFRSRVLAIADRLVATDRDVLVVSHAGMMMHLSKELRRRGWRGPALGIAAHARAYVYERAS